MKWKLFIWPDQHIGIYKNNMMVEFWRIKAIENMFGKEIVEIITQANWEMIDIDAVQMVLPFEDNH